jgi:hypothetical protein
MNSGGRGGYSGGGRGGYHQGGGGGYRGGHGGGGGSLSGPIDQVNNANVKNYQDLPRNTSN